MPMTAEEITKRDARIAHLSKVLADLLGDSHPGLLTWQDARTRTAVELRDLLIDVTRTD